VAVGWLFQCRRRGVVTVAGGERVARRFDGVVVPESRQVERNRSDENQQNGETSSTGADVAASVQRSTDGEVPAYSHVHRQPRAAHLEHVDQTLSQGPTNALTTANNLQWQF